MFTIGCDPEIFLTVRGKPLSAHGIVAGTKKEPFKVEKGAYQVDGMALEFNTDPVPVNEDNSFNGFQKFNDNIVSVMGSLKQAVRDAGYRTASFNISPVQDFGEEGMAAAPEEAKELGCDPDYSAYTLEPNPRPNGDVTFRTASGHIHVGWGADIPVDHPDHLTICADFVKALDTTVGLFMTLIDDEPRRRELYGKAGAFRPKPYGVEYRTPSNVWLTHKARRKIVYGLVSATIRAHKNPRYYGLPKRAAGSIWGGKRFTDFDNLSDETLQNMVRETIDTGNKDLAYKLLHNQIMVIAPGMLRTLKAEYDRTTGVFKARHHDHLVEKVNKEKKVA